MGVLNSRVLLTGMGWDSRRLLKVDFIGLKRACAVVLMGRIRYVLDLIYPNSHLKPYDYSVPYLGLTAEI